MSPIYVNINVGYHERITVVDNASGSRRQSVVRRCTVHLLMLMRQYSWQSKNA